MYQVRFVGDEDLPDGHEWAMVFHDTGGATLIIKQSAICERVLGQAWAVSVEQHRRRAAQRSRELGPLFFHQRSG